MCFFIYAYSLASKWTSIEIQPSHISITKLNYKLDLKLIFS